MGCLSRWRTWRAVLRACNGDREMAKAVMYLQKASGADWPVAFFALGHTVERLKEFTKGGEHDEA